MPDLDLEGVVVKVFESKESTPFRKCFCTVPLPETPLRNSHPACEDRSTPEAKTRSERRTPKP